MTNRKTTKVKSPDKTVEIPSDSTQKKLDELEAAQLKTNAALEAIMEKLNQVNTPQILRAEKPDDRLAAMRKAQVGDKESVGFTNSTDLRNPNAAQTGWKIGSIVQMAESSPKYDAYKLDENGEPVARIYEYQCQACWKVEDYHGGANKKICPECKNTMVRKATNRYEEGTPAYGIIQKFMYVTKKGKRKYKVYFEKFSERQTAEGITENELVLCK